MSTAENEAIVRRFYTELWNDWNRDVADDILAPDLAFRGTLGTRDVGIEHFKRYFDRTRKAFPDLSADIDQLIAVDDAVVARLTWTATHAGEIFGIPPTGERWSYAGVGIFRIEGGRIHDAWIVGDTQELWRAIGHVPPSGAVRDR